MRNSQSLVCRVPEDGQLFVGAKDGSSASSREGCGGGEGEGMGGDAVVGDAAL